MSKILFYLFYAVIWALMWLPLPVLYLISDFFYFLMYYVARYRRKVVRMNLTNSFPEKPIEEIIKIEKEFYRHLSDTFLESFYLLHVSEEEMKKRMKFNNIEAMQKSFAEGKNVIVMLGHYCNWEWISPIQSWLKNVQGSELYRPLKDKNFDSFFDKLRSHFGSVNIPKNDVLRFVVEMKREKKPHYIGFVADQTPSKSNLHYWTQFLNQNTPFFNGAERIARKYDYATVFVDVKKIKRGYYEATIVPICESAKSTDEYYITDCFVELMENMIKRQPAYWLWSHKRWKHKREDAPQNAVERPRIGEALLKENLSKQ